MSHIPINHRFQPVYRVIGGLTGVWLLLFGVLGWSATRDAEWFARGGWTAMGLPTNRAFAAASVAVGLLVLAAALLGHNVDRFINLWGGIAFLVAGTLMMGVSHTALNVLNFSIATSVASYVVGLLLLAAGLYGKVGPPQEQAPERHRRAPAEKST